MLKSQAQIGKYRVDFLIGKNHIFEFDGPRHLSDEQIEYDNKRDTNLRSNGYRILRIKWYVFPWIAEEIVDMLKSVR